MKRGTSVASFIAACIALLMVQYTYSQAPAHTPRFSPFIDNNINGFWEYLPANYSQNEFTRYPLLIFIHGAGEQGSIQDTPTLRRVLRAGPPRLISNGDFPESFSAFGQSYQFIVLSPQIKNGISGVSSIVEPSTIEAFIQYARSNYRIDTNRIYLCGLSMGGGAVWDYAGSSVQAARRLAGIIVAAGAADLSSEEANNIAEADLPVLATHNEPDPLIDVARTRANINMILSYSPSIYPLPRAVYWDNGSHNVWTRTFENLVPGSSPTGTLRDTLGVNVYEWMLQFSRPSAILPVKWQSFVARPQNGKAHLQWIVSDQINVKEYIVERSTNGTQWVRVATVPAVPVSAPILYSHIDAIDPGINYYYRINGVDKDGKHAYSAIKQCRTDGPVALLIYPNPFIHELKIDANLPPANVTVHLTDATGRTVLSQHHIAGTNRELVIKDLGSLPSGSYHLIITDPQGQRLYHSTLMKK